MALPAQAPTALQPNWRHLPRLAWVVARAFRGERWPTRIAGVWALASAALIYLPLLTGAALRKHVAANPDSSGVVVFWTGRRDRLALIGADVAALALFLATLNLVTDLALATVSTMTGVIAVTVVLGAIFALILLPAMVDALAMLAHRRRAKAASAERYTAQYAAAATPPWPSVPGRPGLPADGPGPH